MKNSLLVAVLSMAGIAVVPGYATTVLFTTASTTVYGTTQSFNDGSGDIISATGFTGGVVTGTSKSAAINLDSTTNGLGIQNSGNTDIRYNEFVQLDFSGVKTSGLNQVTFTLNIDQPNLNLSYEIYGVTGAYNPAGKGYTQFNGAPMTSLLPATVLSTNSTTATGGAVNFTVFGGTSGFSTLYTSYIVSVDCAANLNGGLDLTKVGLSYNSPVPEPATFLLVGAALLGLGVSLKRRGQKV